MSKKLKLTKSEEELMGLFWFEDRPLTNVDLQNLAKEHSWSGNYIFNLLNSLQKKGILEVCGIVPYGKQYARQFKPMITKEEYIKEFVLSKSFDIKSVGNILVAMAKESKYNKDLVEQLEEIVEEFRKEENEDKEDDIKATNRKIKER